MTVHSCRSLPQTLATARQRGWLIVGAAAEEGAIAASTFKPERPTILVMGNEGYGLRTMVRQQCDMMLRIDGGDRVSGGMVDSLNVSVATGILLHQLLSPSTFSK